MIKYVEMQRFDENLKKNYLTKSKIILQKKHRLC